MTLRLLLSKGAPVPADAMQFKALRAQAPASAARRALLRGGLGLAGLATLPGCAALTARRLPAFDPAELQALVPARSTLPGIDELDDLCRQLASAGIPVQRIGTSRGGRPINMVSPPSTARLNVLVVGSPHPNEPIGGLTIATLLAMLRSKHPAVAQLPVRWHFVPSIEPDGLGFNGSWLNTPHDYRAYCRGFYRPAFRHQAEYAFPLKTSRYHFDQPTPETRAWMSAIDQLRPAFMASLHNADHGGAFNVLSRQHPELAGQLSRQARGHGIALDEMGDALGESELLAPGVFLAEDLATIVERTQGVWTAGNSSFGYAAVYGTLGLAPEVPLWQEAEVHGHGLLSDAVKGLSGSYEATIALVEQARSLADAGAGADLRWAATDDTAIILRRLMVIHAKLPGVPISAAMANLTRRRFRMLPLRALGMLIPWCQMQARQAGAGDRQRALAGIQQAATDLMERELADASLTAGMVPVPLRAAVAAQLQAVLTAAAAIAT